MKNAIKKIIATTGYSLSKIKKYNIQFENQITKDNFFDLYFSRVNPADFFFLEIGANDGKTNDPIYQYVMRYKLRGIVVEPLPEAFKSLQATYKDRPDVKCVNVLINIVSGEVPFYMPKTSVKTKENSNITVIPSLKKKVLEHTLGKRIKKGENLEENIQAVPMHAITINQLLIDHSVTKVDMIQIDTEGMDWEILKTLDFDRFAPTIINFESNHLSDTDRMECQSMLEARGYRWFRHGIDTCAYKA